jgi:hypothetical protein
MIGYGEPGKVESVNWQGSSRDYVQMKRPCEPQWSTSGVVVRSKVRSIA